MDAYRAAEVFRRTEVPDPSWRRVYVLGSFVRHVARFSQQPRVTLVSQQTRALNLVSALLCRGIVKPGDQICVVGAGVAGVTAAAAAAYRGCEVTLLESKGALLPLLFNSTRRWLHPHLYEWPDAVAGNDEAGLPIINWRAATASRVFKQIETGFRRWHDETRRIKPFVNVREIALVPIPEGWEVAWNGGAGIGRFSAVILAVGFGAERPFDGIDFVSYWDNDNLDREDVRPGRLHTHHLISGTGDGGLTDFLRVRLRRFDHEDTFREFLTFAPANTLRTILRQAEDEAVGDAGKLASAYYCLAVPSIDEWIRVRLNPRTSATLHDRGRHPYITKASALNRFLVSRVLKLDQGVSSIYQPGELIEPIIRDSAVFRVALNVDGQRHESSFDHVTIRHGVDPALKAINSAIYDACQKLPAGEEPDPMRTPLWEDGFFGAVSPSSVEWVEPSPSPVASAGVDAMNRAAVPRFQPTGHIQAIAVARRPTRVSLRALLREILPVEADIEEFCLDRFQISFPPRLSHQEMITVLFRRVRETRVLLEGLRKSYPNLVAEHDMKLEYENEEK